MSSKSARVRDYIRRHPKTRTKTIALTFNVSESLVSNMRTKVNAEIMEGNKNHLKILDRQNRNFIIAEAANLNLTTGEAINLIITDLRIEREDHG